MGRLLEYPLPIIFVASVIVFACASEFGHRFGVHQDERENVATLEGAMLGLLALILGFTFSMALARFEARRDALLTEANAIGTAALRARLLPSPQADESLKLFRDYAQLRLDLFKQPERGSDLNAIIGRSNKIQEALWLQAKTAAAHDNAMVPTGLFIEALNLTFDSQATRLAALRNRVPEIVYAALYGIACGVMGFAGFASGVAKRLWRPPVYLTAVLVATVILLIEDIDRPGEGFIIVSQQPMIDTAQSIASYISEMSPPAAKGAR
jgi:hypothetical protein